ncbi:MAG: DUF3853 family protein [Bacteroidales bacterium]|nr:DUF3853 family protein [Bacteroidales bacterium]
MNLSDLLQKPIWQMTGEEFLELSRCSQPVSTAVNVPAQNPEKKYVYGIAGIAEIFNCSLPTANRIKKSGRINAAITQIGRKIVIDVEKAIELAGMNRDAHLKSYRR